MAPKIAARTNDSACRHRQVPLGVTQRGSPSGVLVLGRPVDQLPQAVQGAIAAFNDGLHVQALQPGVAPSGGGFGNVQGHGGLRTPLCNHHRAQGTRLLKVSQFHSGLIPSWRMRGSQR